ncbi:MAG: alpha/beta hydrolase [Chlorobium sp.]|nr:alpha/beta hydrolase [Chlorobium sp.]
MKNLKRSLYLFLFCSITLIAQITATDIQKDTVFSFDKEPIVYEKAGAGEPTLVFVHCWSCDKSYWAGQIDYFSKNYKVIAIDLAGHGESGLGRVDWTIENYAKDVKAVIDNEKLDKIILIGHSMGGPVVLAAAQLLGNKVKALITIDTFQDIEQKYTQEELDKFYKAFEKDFVTTTKEFVKGMFPENADSTLITEIAEDMSSAPPNVALASFRSLFKFNEAANFDKINIPVRFINSNKFPTNIEAAKRHIKDFDLKIIEGVGHFPMLEKTEEFNKIVEEIINNLE